MNGSNPGAVGQGQVCAVVAQPIEGVIGNQQGAVQIELIAERSQVSSGSHAQRAFDHARKHDLHPMSAGGMDGAQGFAQAASFHELDHHPIDAPSMASDVLRVLDTFVNVNRRAHAALV